MIARYLHTMVKPVICLFLFIAMLVFPAFSGASQPIPEIVLQNAILPFTPKEFYVARVIDEREDKSAIAWLIPVVNKAGSQAKLYSVDLKGGGFVAIKQFIGHNLPVDTQLHPIVISIKKFTTTESIQPGSNVEGHAVLQLSFSLGHGDEDDLHLVDFTGTAVYNRTPGPAQEIEPALRQLLISGLGYLNKWMDREAATNVKLARAVKVTFTDFIVRKSVKSESPKEAATDVSGNKPNYIENNEGDTIYYAVNRPLTWADFQSTIASSKFDAEVFPTIGYDEYTEVKNGCIFINLTIKTTVPKSGCWAKEGVRNAYILNHEQRHFDIAKIAAERFKQKIKALLLPVNNFDGPINMAYLDAFREMDKLQKQYDDETEHGSDQAAQQRWNMQIDNELRQLGVIN